MANERIPLFPLNLVLLPGNVLPLHIFEPRYKLMIGDVVARSEPFGVVRAHENGVARVGCSAIVVRVIKTYEDGRMDILTVGQNAFRITEVFQEKPFLEAAVDFLADEDDPAVPPPPAELRGLFEKCYRLAHGAAPEVEPDTTPIERNMSVAYKLAAELPLDLDAKQELLEVRSEPARQRLLLEQLQKLLLQLTRIAQMRQQTSSNGHGLH